MRKMLHWLFSRKVVIFWVCFSTIYDLIFTYVVFRLHPELLQNNGEYNTFVRDLIQTYGLDYALLVIMPLIMAFVILMGYRFWNFKLVRFYMYFLFVARIGLFIYNFFVIYTLAKY
ncbi:MAG: hypothetical protein G01um10143_452 [Parcubacteria group bacterium Gr01-1014_3]|nr:MAG: hypothetical protein G01um10143_452 [Parcubacteria group bacterium Gr01-1014_3]